MSLRRRLVLSLFTILVLFAVNVGTHFWGSYARSESMVAYRDAVTAAQMSTEVEQELADQRQRIRVLATLRDTTDDQFGAIILAWRVRPNREQAGQARGGRRIRGRGEPRQATTGQD